MTLKYRRYLLTTYWVCPFFRQVLWIKQEMISGREPVREGLFFGKLLMFLAELPSFEQEEWCGGEHRAPKVMRGE